MTSDPLFNGDTKREEVLMGKYWTDGAAGRFARSMEPMDHSLLDQARRNAGHISEKAVMDEYDRLLEAKLRQHPRSLWSRIFGN